MRHADNEKLEKRMQQTSTEGLQDKVWLGGEGDQLEIVQVIKIWPYYVMFYIQTRIHPKKLYP